jgi:hypothetical protein
MEMVDSVNWINSLGNLTCSEKQAILSENPAQMLGI